MGSKVTYFCDVCKSDQPERCQMMAIKAPFRVCRHNRMRDDIEVRIEACRPCRDSIEAALKRVRSNYAQQFLAEMNIRGLGGEFMGLEGTNGQGREGQ